MNENPNVIVITTDQQRLDSLNFMGSSFIKTPNLNRLADEGVSFSRAYCTNPVCTPARASIFSGLQVSRHGAWNVGTKISEDTPMLGHHLGKIGYRTHYVGKAHFQPFGSTESKESLRNWNNGEQYTNGPYYGFETVELASGHTTYGMTGSYGDWILDNINNDKEKFDSFKETNHRTEGNFQAKAIDTKLPSKYQNSVWTAERACDFLKKQDQEQPFLLGIGFQDPHHPHAVPEDYENRVDPDEVPLPDYQEGELDDKPPHFKLARKGEIQSSDFVGEHRVAGVGGGEGYENISDKEASLGRAYYYTLIQLIDQEIGKILDCLEEKNLSDNTIVVFTTDHGELLGDHGLWLKGPFLYEELINIPMIIKWPQGFSSGLKTDALFSAADLVPTIMSSIGQSINKKDFDGIDQSAVLKDEVSDLRDHVLIECIDNPDKLRLKTVVTSDYKLTWYAGYEFGELYNLDQDPKEKNNLWDNKDYIEVKARLMSKIIDDLEKIEHRENRICYA